MSKDDPCRCGATAAWLLSPVREHEGPMAVEVHGSGRKFEQLGWYEALVCGGCGYARFWARDFAPERVQQPIDACAACENTSGWIVAAVPDVVGPRDAVGVDVQLATTKRKLSLIFSWHGWHAVLAARICGACGTAAWFCRPEPAPFPEDLELAPRSPEPCHRCGGARARVRLDDVQPKDRGYGHEWRTISGHQGFWSFHGEGHFVLDVCLSCFGAEWYGTNLEQLIEDPGKGISRVDLGPSQSGGPYR